MNCRTPLNSSEIGLIIGSIDLILHDHLIRNKVSAQWVPCLLTWEQKKQNSLYNGVQWHIHIILEKHGDYG